MPPFDLKSVTCATSVPILVFLGLSVLDLGPMHATDRQHHRLMPPPRGILTMMMMSTFCNAQFKQSSNAPLLHCRAQLV